jgi:hypothetical protein
MTNGSELRHRPLTQTKKYNMKTSNYILNKKVKKLSSFWNNYLRFTCENLLQNIFYGTHLTWPHPYNRWHIQLAEEWARRMLPQPESGLTPTCQELASH